jgi:hypothetical protein
MKDCGNKHTSSGATLFRIKSSILRANWKRRSNCFSRQKMDNEIFPTGYKLKYGQQPEQNRE